MPGRRDDSNTGGNSMFNGGGSASVLRMFNTTLGGQDRWLLPFGLFSIFALLSGMRKSTEANSEIRRKRRANILLWGGSVITMFTYFSIAQFFHPYYISVMAPFLAALVGIGLTEMWKLYKTKGFVGFLLPLALAATGAVQILMLRSYPSYSGVLIPIVAVVTGISALLLLMWKLLHRNTTGKLATACIVLGITGLLVAVPSASEAEPIILATGKPVMAIGGFSGNDNTLTVTKLQQMMEQGELKHFLIGGKGDRGNSSNEVTKWVKENGTAVDSNEWSNSSSFSADKIMGNSNTSGTLYDLSSYKG